MEATHVRLIDAGVVTVLPPALSSAGPTKGTRYMKLLDPDGIPIELIELPAG